MATIPILKLPSSGLAVAFRESTIEDCLNYCNLNDAFDESLATEYLNTIQCGTVSDSALWTAEDRRLALWWVFICTSPESTIGYEYECQHCGESHLQLVDLLDLDSEATSLTVEPFLDDKLMFNGTERAIRLHPYDGRAMVHMESLRLERDSYSPDSKEYERESARLKLFEIAHAFDFLPEKAGFLGFLSSKSDAPKSFDDALDEKYKAIASMSRISEFPLLVAAIKAAQEKLKHGLNMSFIDGQAHMVSPPLPCETKVDEKGEAMSTRLLIPFRCSVFIPTI